MTTVQNKDTLAVKIGTDQQGNDVNVQLLSTDIGYIILGGEDTAKEDLTKKIASTLVRKRERKDVRVVFIGTKENKIRYLERTTHYNVPIKINGTLLGQLEQVESTRVNRQNRLLEENYEDVRSLRSDLKSQDKIEKFEQFPYLYVILQNVDEELLELRKESEEDYQEVCKLLGLIVSKMRMVGIRFILTTKQTGYETLPKQVLANIDHKIAMAGSGLKARKTLLNTDKGSGENNIEENEALIYFANRGRQLEKITLV